MPPALEDEAEETDGEEEINDTIVVKGEYEGAWSHPSPAQEMSPSLEPLVNHLLASITPTHLESPAHISSDEDYENELRTPLSQQQPKHKQQRLNNLTMEERLQLMPPKRPLPWRPGVEPGADNETGGESRRKQIRFGCLLATRGEEQAQPCKACANGRGKFSICIAQEGFFKGACASCQLSGRPNRCSIKVNDDGPESSPMNNPGAASIVHDGTSEGPRPKRKRTTTKKQREGVPEWESARPQWEQELGDAQARQNKLAQPWAPINPHLSAQASGGMIHGGSNTRDAPRQSMEGPNPNPMDWAAVNQHSPAPAAQRSTTANGECQEHAKRDGTVIDDKGGALIDALPKQKQRQVYGIISGLQGGIEHLQRELDSLKRALGIDED